MSGLLKLISPLVHPVGFGWLLLVLTACLCLRRRRWMGAFIALFLSVAIWLLAQPPLVGPLLGSLERPWLQHTLVQAPRADAVVVLGGGWRASKADFVGLDLTAAVDRWITGVELCRQGKAPVLVIGGDPLRPGAEGPPDSRQLQEWIARWGFRDVECVSLGPVGNTRDEAQRTRDLFQQRGWREVLLVTSAFHMRRAVAVFEKAGVRVIPVACDFQVERFAGGSAGWRPFPDEEALMTLTLWWHEQLGWFAYRLFGHI